MSLKDKILSEMVISEDMRHNENGLKGQRQFKIKPSPKFVQISKEASKQIELNILREEELKKKETEDRKAFFKNLKVNSHSPSKPRRKVNEYERIY